MKAVDYRENRVRILDQSILPKREEMILCDSPEKVADAISGMRIRGGPSIGVAAAYGMVLGEDKERAARVLKETRPTAVDLFHAIDYVLNRISEGQSSLEAARDWDMDNSERCKKISEKGAGLIKNGSKILTHCNTGFLAANSHGTALGAIVRANRKGLEFEVMVGETRPKLQGALTSWELLRENVLHRVIADSSAGHLMKDGHVDMVMVGADRIAENGDFANKIGTYQLSILAKEHNIPFYVLAPITSYDFDLKNGSSIIIETRDDKELLEMDGKRLYPEGARGLNPVFDITSGENVTAFINEYGIFDHIGRVKEIA